MKSFWEGFEKQAMSPATSLATRLKSISLRTLSEGRPAQSIARAAEKVAPKATRSVAAANASQPSKRMEYIRSMMTSPSDWRKAMAGT